MSQYLSRRTIGVGAVCVAVGAFAGIAGSAASTNTHTSRDATTTSTKPDPSKGGRPPGGRGGPGGPGGPGVHSVAVVLNKAGDGFVTVTSDQGTVKSVSGSDVTITEGIGSVTYQDATVTVAAGATIRRNGATATLADLQAGDHVRISSSSEGTEVDAASDAWQAAHRPPRGPGGPGHGGPGGPPPKRP